MDDDEQQNLEKGQPEQTERLRQTEAKVEQVEAGRETDAEHDRQEQDRKTSKHRYGLLIAAIIFLIVAVAGLATWLILGSQGDDEPKGPETSGEPEEEEGKTDDNRENEGDGSGDKADEIVALSVDDELVQKLWGQFGSRNFDNSALLITKGTEDFYTEAGALSPDGMTDVYKALLALNNLYYRGEYDSIQIKGSGPCKVTHLRDGVTPVFGQGSGLCVPAEVVQEKAREVFGSDVDLLQLEGVEGMVNGDGYTYFADGNEFALVGSGATGSLVRKRMYRAEKDGERVYVYEVAVQLPYGLYLDEEGKCSYAFGQDGPQCNVIYKLNGGDTVKLDDVMTYDSLIEYKEQLDRFKYIFRKTTEGNYVFEKLEKVEQ